jgi:ATP-dependent DNA ligase
VANILMQVILTGDIHSRLPVRMRRGHRDAVEQRGTAPFNAACAQGLEGIVAKWRDGLSVLDERSSWVKIKNSNYTQAQGRAEPLGRSTKAARP